MSEETLRKLEFFLGASFRNVAEAAMSEGDGAALDELLRPLLAFLESLEAEVAGQEHLRNEIAALKELNGHMKAKANTALAQLERAQLDNDRLTKELKALREKQHAAKLAENGAS